MLGSDFCGQAEKRMFCQKRKLDVVAQEPWGGGGGWRVWFSRLVTISSQPASQACTQNAQPPKG